MKKLLLFAVIAIVAFSLSIVGCSKDKEQDPIQWKFEVKADKDTISNLALNDIVPVTYVVNRKYNTGATMQYRVNLDKSQGFTIYDNNDNEIKDFGFQNLTSDTLKLKYKGTFQGIYSLSVTFKNSKNERVDKRVAFEYGIKNKNKEFNIEQKVNANLNNITQGQDVELSFEVKEVANTEEEFQIQFLKFDEADEYLQKSKIYLNNNEIEINKWYSINKGSINKILLNSFNAGNKKLVYQIKNSVYTKDKELDINVKKATISLKNLTLKADKIYINEPFKIEGKVEKTYSNVKNIEYKTWLSSGNAAHLKDITNTYRSYKLSDENNIFSLEFNAVNVGNFTLKIQAKDEFGNESEVKEFNIKADSKLEIEESTVVYNVTVVDKLMYTGDSNVNFDFYVTSDLKIKAKAGNGNLLFKAEVEIENFKGLVKGIKTEVSLDLKNQVEKSFVIFSKNNDLNWNQKALMPYSGAINIENPYPYRVYYDERIYKKWKEIKPKAKVTLYDNMGNRKEIETNLIIKYKHQRENNASWYTDSSMCSDYYCPGKAEEVQRYFKNFYSWVLEED